MKVAVLKRKIIPYTFTFPYFFLFLAFALFPILFSGYISLTNWDGFNEREFVGLVNYVTLLRDRRFFISLTNTLLLMLMIIPFQILLGLVMALLLSGKYMPLRKTFRLLNFLPFLTTPIALGMIFSIMFDANFGTVNRILQQIGIASPPNWISDIWPARFMTAIITVWRYAGYTSVLFMAGIANINPELYEASEIDGANTMQRICHITLPLLRRVTVFVVITTMIGCFQIFEEPYMVFQVMGGMTGGPRNAVLTGIWFFYDVAFGSAMKYSYGSAVAIGLLICLCTITAVANKLMKDKGEDK